MYSRAKNSLPSFPYSYSGPCWSTYVYAYLYINVYVCVYVHVYAIYMPDIYIYTSHVCIFEYIYIYEYTYIYKDILTSPASFSSPPLSHSRAVSVFSSILLQLLISARNCEQTVRFQCVCERLIDVCVCVCPKTFVHTYMHACIQFHAWLDAPPPHTHMSTSRT